MRRRTAGALLAVTVGVLPGCGAATGPAAAGAGRGGCAAPFRPGVAAHPGRPAWIIAAGALPRLRQAGLPVRLFHRYFDRPAALVLVSRSRRDALVPRASPALDFTSAAALVRALSRGLAGPAVRYLLLDLERWPLTPAGEQRDPIGALRRAAAAAHAHGKCLVFAPAIDLVGVRHPGTSGAALYSLFVSSIVAPGAALSDVFVVQSQHSEGSPDGGGMAAQAIRAAGAAHPVPVLAGLSSNPDGRRVTPADLLALYRAGLAAGGAGYWLNIPQSGAECPRCGRPQPRVAVAFLEAAAGNRAG